MLWKGNTENQYNLPQIPNGLNVAVCARVLFSSILNSNQASPGNFISANKTNLFSSLLAINTFQKSILSPAEISFGSCLPFLSPMPPITRSKKPLNFHSQLA